MPRQSNVDLLSGYRRRIVASKKWRQEEGYDTTWRRLIDLYRGKHYEYLSEEDRLLINISFSTVNVIAPSVSVNNPKIAVSANKPDNAPQALITEAVINYWWRHYKVKPEFRRAVKDFLVVGHGWLKNGWRFVKDDPDPNDPDVDISDENIDGADITPISVITEDRPFVERVSPFDVFVDPDGTSMSDIRWIAQRVRRPLHEVKTDKRYSAVARGQVTPTSWAKLSGEDSPRREIQDDEMGYVEVWEFYDLVKRTLSVFADGSDNFLVKPQPMPYSFGHPFVMIRNYDVPDHFYPMGDLEAIEPLQRELNETRTQMMNHRKRFARKYLYQKDAFDTDGREALESDEDNVMVPVNGDQPLQNVVVPMPAIITPPEFYNQSQMIQSDVENVSGVSEYQRGGTPDIRRTATEAAIVQDAANARAADKLATIEMAIGDVAARLVQLAQQFMDGEQVARVYGRDGAAMWVTFDADYIAGEFDFEVEGGSTAPVNESFRAQRALQMVDALAPFMQLGVVNPMKLATHVLQFGFGVKDAESWLQAPPTMGPDGQPMPPEGEGGGAPVDATMIAQLAQQMGMGGGEAEPPAG